MKARLFTPDLDDKLIQMVKFNPIVYDFSTNNSSVEKEATWRRISNVLRVEVDACKMRWRTIRDSYLKTMKKTEAKLSSVSPSTPKSKYFSDKLQFLKDAYKHKMCAAPADADKQIDNAALAQVPQPTTEELPGHQKDQTRLESITNKEKPANKLTLHERFQLIDADRKRLREFVQPIRLRCTFRNHNLHDEAGPSMRETGHEEQEVKEDSQQILKEEPVDQSKSSSEGLGIIEIKEESEDDEEEPAAKVRILSNQETCLQDSTAKSQIMNIMKEELPQVETKTAPENPLDLFFKSMVETVKTFPPQLQAETRLRICQAVTEMEIKALNEENPKD